MPYPMRRSQFKRRPVSKFNFRGQARSKYLAKRRNTFARKALNFAQRIKPMKGHVMPRRMRTTLTYGYGTTATVAAGGYSNFFTARGSDLYDPDFAVGGAQPRGFDQLMGLYKKFNVYASQITLTAQPTAGSAGIMIGLRADPDSASAPTVTTIAHFLEQYVQIKPIAAVDAGPAVATIKSFRRTKNVLTGHSIADTEYSGSAAATPQNYWVWRCGLMNGHPSSSTTIVYSVTIKYYVEFSDPLEVAAS